MTDEELIARLRKYKDDLLSITADRIEALTAELATCEKYRDAYAECDRIGTQAVRDLEAKLAKAEAGLRDIAAECGCSIARAAIAELKGETP